MLSGRDVRWATVLGLGSLRPAPGTWGSLPPVVLAGALIALGLGPTQSPIVYNAVMGAMVILACAACVLQGDAAETHFMRKDPPNVVADEVAGQSLALLALPAAATAGLGTTAFTLFYAFICFRVFDIVKPPPADGLQKVAGGWGIVLDDLISGIYAMIMVQVMTRVML
jgi:phosphatidylglycerophosphatase A